MLGEKHWRALRLIASIQGIACWALPVQNAVGRFTETLIAAMAGHVDNFMRETAPAEMIQRRRVSDQVARVFGWKPESVRFLSGELCFVQVRGGFCRTVQFILANGLLVNIPPKKRQGF